MSIQYNFNSSLTVYQQKQVLLATGFACQQFLLAKLMIITKRILLAQQYSLSNAGLDN